MIEIDLGSAIPIYEQLILEIKKGIINHDVRADQELPSVRNLASDLGVNLHTVNKAYKSLEEQGIVARKKNRFVVNNQATFKKNEQWKKEIASCLYKIGIEQKLHEVKEEEMRTMYLDTLKSIYESE